MVLGALRATGSGSACFDPFEAGRLARRAPDLPGWEARETIRDPALAGWLYGADLVAAPGVKATTFTLWRPPGPAARAWLVPLTAGARPRSWSRGRATRPRSSTWSSARQPLTIRADRPERLEIAVQADGPARVLVSQLADPLWEARWLGPAGDRPATIDPVLRLPNQGGWQAVTVPGPGRGPSV